MVSSLQVTQDAMTVAVICLVGFGMPLFFLLGAMTRWAEEQRRR